MKNKIRLVVIYPLIINNYHPFPSNWNPGLDKYSLGQPQGTVPTGHFLKIHFITIKRWATTRDCPNKIIKH